MNQNRPTLKEIWEEELSLKRRRDADESSFLGEHEVEYDDDDADCFCD